MGGHGQKNFSGASHRTDVPQFQIGSGATDYVPLTYSNADF